MKHKGLLLADLHIGVIDPKRQYEEIESIIFTTIKKEIPDYIIFLGDYFDRKAALNDHLSKYSVMIFSKLIDLCESINEKMKIRLIYGTESHEWNQYVVLNILFWHTKLDIKVINYAEEELLFDDLKVLYLPEEHLLNKGEYYQKYLSKPKEYDYIFGHGIIREIMKEAAIHIDSSTSTRKKVPVFTTGELTYACKGQIYFGHYHIHTNMNDTVFYVGSFNRWQFGEEEPKGIELVTKTKNDYKEKFIENTMTDVYKTISFGFENTIFQSMEKLEKKLNQIDQMIKDQIFDHVRFQFNIPENAFDAEYIMNYLKERYKFNKRVKLLICNGYAKTKKETAKKEVEEWNRQNAPIFDRNLPIEEKVSYFIGLEFKREISPEKTELYLNHELNEILEKV